MKYIKKYNFFIENYEISDTDRPDVKSSKENLNKLKDQLSEYNSKKGQIDKLYNNNDKVESSDLEKIIGKDSDKNPFLTSYSSILSNKKRIESLKKRENDKNIEVSNFKDRLRDADDSESRSKISNRVGEIENQISEIKKEINELGKKIPELEKVHKERVQKVEDDMKEWIDKIQ